MKLSANYGLQIFIKMMKPLITNVVFMGMGEPLLKF